MALAPASFKTLGGLAILSGVLHSGVFRSDCWGVCWST